MRAQVRARNGALDGWRFGVLIGALIQCLPSAAVAQATPTEPAQPSPKLSARAAVPAPAPTPTAKVLDLAARLGAIDSAAQHIVSAPTGTRMMQESDFIAARWPGVRSALVQAGAKRADLLIADGALRNLRTGSESESQRQRAANTVTAALAPLYPVAGDRVPPRIHRLDYLLRAVGLDAVESNWVRATADVVSIRSAWQTARSGVVDHGGNGQALGFDRAIGAMDDAIGARNSTRTTIALAAADKDLAAVEKVFDRQDPPWRRFIHEHFGV
jgi:hypothetical protein